MIVHNGHEVQELYRQGRKVKAVIRKGKRVFGIEPLKTIKFEANIREFDKSLSYEGFVFSSVIQNGNRISEIIDVTGEEPYKVYMYTAKIGDKNYLALASRYYGADSIFAPTYFTQDNHKIKLDFSLFDWSYCTRIFLQTFKGDFLNLDKVNFSENCKKFSLGESTIVNFSCPLADFSGITSLNYMFGWSTRLEYVDFSNANFSKVITITDTSSCFNANSKLYIIKTPAISAKVDIALPTTFYNADGSVYGNVIPANSVGSVTIYRTRELAQQHNPELFT